MALLGRIVCMILGLLLNNILLCTANDDDDDKKVTLTVNSGGCNLTKSVDDVTYILQWNGENFSPSCSFKFTPKDENHKICVDPTTVNIKDCQVSAMLYFFEKIIGSASETFTCNNSDTDTQCGELSESVNITLTSIYSIGSFTPNSFQTSEIKMEIYDEYVMPVYLILIIAFFVLGLIAVITIVIIVIIVKMNKRNRVQGKVLGNGRSVTTGNNPYNRQQLVQQQHQQQSYPVYPRQPQQQYPFPQHQQTPNRLPPLNQPPNYPDSTNTGQPLNLPQYSTLTEPMQAPSSSQYTDEQLYGDQRQVQPSAPPPPPPAYSSAADYGFDQQPQEKY